MKIEKNATFLKTFIREEIYLIDEGREMKSPATPVSEAVAPAQDKQAEETQVLQEPVAGLVILLKNELSQIEVSQKALLEKIMSAVKTDLSATPVLTEARYRNDPRVIGRYQKVLSFGVELPQAPARYQLISKEDQQFLVSDSLAALEQAIALKGKLWAAMQKMFGA